VGPTVSRAVRKQVVLFNIATLVTVVIGVTVLYAALYLLALVAAFWFVVPKIFREAVGHPVSLRDYFELAWLTCSLAMVGGAPWVRRWNLMMRCAKRPMCNAPTRTPKWRRRPDLRSSYVDALPGQRAPVP
jgi:hypothetical protein